ncbi:MFS transporter [Streptomyces noursei]|uniref:MFS transporter n=1 Tax=Streptomyces noursei TaxID=1971 RepID=UPI001A938B08|nr:MFS transporter [Streptomyces noursei]
MSVRQRRRVLVAALLSDAVFPLAITGATAAVPEVTAQVPGADALGPWIVLAYNGLFAAALLLAGAGADRSARTRFFAVGNAVVAVAGMLSALAPDVPSLVALRAVGGVGAAMCAAGGSSMVLAVYPPEERRRVYGYAGPCWAAAWRWGRPLPRRSWRSVDGRWSSRPREAWPRWRRWGRAGFPPCAVRSRPRRSTSPGPCSSGWSSPPW